MLVSIITFLLGTILLICGIRYPAYALPNDFYDIHYSNRLNYGAKQIKKIENFITPPQNTKVYRAVDKLISMLDVEITVPRLWFYKTLCIILSFILLTVISSTNTKIAKQNIMGLWWQDSGLMNTITPEEYRYNVHLYNDVLKRIGEQNLKKATDEEKVKKIAMAIQEIKGGTYGVTGRAEAFVSAYKNIENISIMTINTILGTLISFFIPEILLFMRKIIIGRKYKNEAIKMENIFGLLGSMEEYKTIFILKDMALASKLFSKPLEHAATIFYTDRNKSFEYLKNSVNQKSFNRLVDVMRIYSTIDKKLALSILERNLKEHEEQLLLSAEEDMDVVDILAFISIVPILYEIADLMLSPMLEIIFKVFNFV